MRADIHDGPEHMLQSEAGYIDARPLTPARQNLLQRTAGPYIRVKLRRTQCEHNVFRFALELGHCSMRVACLKRATSGLISAAHDARDWTVTRLPRRRAAGGTKARRHRAPWQ